MVAALIGSVALYRSAAENSAAREGSEDGKRVKEHWEMGISETRDNEKMGD